MGHLITLALVLFAGSCYASQRIVGGNDAAIESYPSAVQIEFQGISSNVWSQNCAGTILNNIYILSAASCFSGMLYDPSLRRIRAGSATRNAGGLIGMIYQVINHPDFDVAAPFDSDISLIIVDGFLPFGPTISLARIPTSTSVLADNMAVVKAGWGRIEESGQFASQLQEVVVFTVNHEVCRNSYAELPIPAVVTDNMFCAGILNGGRDSCGGDAGGPIYIGDIVVGVISWGHGCGVPNYPGVATNLIAFSDWISSVTG